jgi:hypothetical protein
VEVHQYHHPFREEEAVEDRHRAMEEEEVGLQA